MVLALLAAACAADTADGPGTAGGDQSAAPASDAIVELTPRADLAPAPDDEVHVAYAPAVPPPADRSDQRVFEVRLEVLEGECPLDPANGVTTEMWGYRIAGDTEVVCGSPGPVLRGRVGDVARIVLTNLPGNRHPHNIDFHAVTGQGGGARDLTVAPGETAAVEVRLLYPGAFMYHCAIEDVPAHIAHGMYGMFIVDPAEPLGPVDHEWAIMQSEWYVDEPDGTGHAAFNREALTAEHPRYVTFNGRVGALVDDGALHMAVGERARIYFVNEGLNLDSNFHPIGSHWDVVYPEAATHPSNPRIRGSQSTLVVAGGGTVVELVGIVPSTVILVDHALVRTFDKGALGQIVIEGPENPEIYTTTDPPTGPAPGGSAAPTTTAAPAGAPTGEPVETDTVTITEGAFDPANADRAYDPPVIRVAVGTTVTWVNRDRVVHTVTSGRSDGRVGTPDGRFDSGDLEPGDRFSVTFDEPGTFTYYCVPHPWMRGTVIVES